MSLRAVRSLNTITLSSTQPSKRLMNLVKKFWTLTVNNEEDDGEGAPDLLCTSDEEDDEEDDEEEDDEDEDVPNQIDDIRELIDEMFPREPPTSVPQRNVRSDLPPMTPLNDKAKMEMALMLAMRYSFTTFVYV